METLQIFQAIGIFAIFAACVALMMARKLPTILALPIMAVGIALVAGIPFISSDAEQFTVAKDVLEAGAMRMSTAIAGLIFGGFFGKVLTKVGVTHTIIRKAAELAGDKPLPIALAFLVVASLIFAASNGLGMVILVGTIIIPIMISAGVSLMTTGAVLLFANGIGVTFSVGTLGVYIDTLGLPLETVTSYSWLCGIPLMIVAVAWIVCSVKGGKVRKAWAMPAGEPAAESLLVIHNFRNRERVVKIPEGYREKIARNYERPCPSEETYCLKPYECIVLYKGGSGNGRVNCRFSVFFLVA